MLFRVRKAVGQQPRPVAARAGQSFDRGRLLFDPLFKLDALCEPTVTVVEQSRLLVVLETEQLGQVEDYALCVIGMRESSVPTGRSSTSLMLTTPFSTVTRPTG